MAASIQGDVPAGTEVVIDGDLPLASGGWSLGDLIRLETRVEQPAGLLFDRLAHAQYRQLWLILALPQGVPRAP